MFHCPVGVWVIEQHAMILNATVRSPTVSLQSKQMVCGRRLVLCQRWISSIIICWMERYPSITKTILRPTLFQCRALARCWFHQERGCGGGVDAQDLWKNEAHITFQKHRTCLSQLGWRAYSPLEPGQSRSSKQHRLPGLGTDTQHTRATS